MTTTIVTTAALVLRKTEYGETSLIIATLTKEHGRQDFMLKGARRQSAKRFPVVDLFRLVEIVYKPSATRDLHAARSIDLIAAHDAVAGNRRRFETALWLSKFVLANSKADIPAPMVFQATRTAFLRLASGDPGLIAPIIFGIGLVMLSEHGLLPDYPGNPDQEEKISQMIDYAVDFQRRAPDYDDHTWRALVAWLRDFIDRNGGIQLPALPERS